MTRILRLFLSLCLGLLAGPALASARATLTIDNQRNDRVEVLVDRAELGDVRGGSTRSFRVKSGRHEVQIIDRNGRVLKQASMNLTRERTSRISLEQAMGRLVLDNPTGADLDIRIDGRSLGTLSAGSSRSFSLREGSHRVQASFEVLGRDIDIEDLNIDLRENGRREIRLKAPSLGLVRVENRTGRAGTLYVDGERQHMLDPGQVTVLELPVGTARLSLKVRQRELDSARVEVRPFKASFFEPELRTGELRINNPLRVAVRVEVDGSQSVAIAPHSSRVFDDLLEGRVSVLIEDHHGLVIERTSMEIRAGARRSLEVPEPEMTLLELQSDHHTRTDVYVDSERVGSLAAHQQLRLAIEPGMHRVQVRDPAGKVLLDRKIRADLYEILSIDVAERSVAHSTGSGGHIRPGGGPSGRVYVVD
jgi:hypothetical protein